MKANIAIFLHGGIGGGFFSQGQPPVQSLILGLSQNYNVDVFSMLPPNPDFKPQCFQIHTPDLNWRISFIRWVVLVLKFIKVYRRKKHKILYSFWGYPSGFITVVLAKTFGIPSVIHLQGGDSVGIASIKYGALRNPFIRFLCLKTYGYCDELVVLSNYQYTTLKKHGLARKVNIVPYGVDLRKFNYCEDRFNKDVLRFLHVGNQTRIKDQETLLKAFSSISKKTRSHLNIVGGDFFDGRLAYICKNLGIEELVTFIGPVKNEMMPHYYFSADILLHTSIYEAQGLVFAEAATCGTLIAGTNVGMLADMGSTCGIIVNQKDFETLADQILDILEFPDKIYQMRLAAREWAETKNFDFTLRTISNLIEGIIKRDDYEC